MEEDENIKSLVSYVEKYYADYPVIRGLIQLIPYGVGSALDVIVVEKIREIQKERLRTFFDALDKRKIRLTEDTIKNNDFLHAYFSTVRYVLNIRREEKIRLFANLFSTYCGEEKFDQTDEYEEFLEILDDLSFREFTILQTISSYESRTPRADSETDYQWVDHFWKELLEDLGNTLGMPVEEILGYLTRLNRTGLYKTFTGAIFGYAGDEGMLTPNFTRFVEALGIDVINNK